MQKISFDFHSRGCCRWGAQVAALSLCLLAPWAVQAQSAPVAPLAPSSAGVAGTVAVAVPTALMASPAAADPALEARVLQVAEELRCLVCQNETVAASHAELAIDLRQQIRQQLQQGRTEAQILDFMVQRYGDFVLYRPPLKASTVLLWLGPFVLLLGALVALVLQIRQRRASAGAAGAQGGVHGGLHDNPAGRTASPLSDADRRLAERLLGESLERP